MISNTSFPCRSYLCYALQKRVGSREFAVDGTFTEDASADAVFKVVRPLVDAAALGYNSCVVSAGAASAATLHGSRGVVPRALTAAFARARGVSASPAGAEVRLSYVEVAADGFRDLLAPPASAPHITVHEARGRGVFLTGSDTLRMRADSLGAALDMVARGRAAMSGAPGAHSVLVVDIETSGSSDGDSRAGRFFVVDTSAGTDGADFALTALGDVLGAAAATKDLWLIPYRSSPLTFLLRDAVGGSARVVVLAHCKDEASHFRASMETLTWAQRARPDVETADAETMELRMEVEAMREKVATLKKERDEAQAENEVLKASVKAQEDKAADGGRAPSRRSESEKAVLQRQLRRMGERLEAAERFSDPHLFQKLQDAVAEIEEHRKVAEEARAAELESEEIIVRAADKLAATKAKWKEQVAELREEISATRAECRAKITEMEVELSDAQARVQKAERATRDAELEALDAADEVDKLKQLLKVARDEITRRGEDAATQRAKVKSLEDRFRSLAQRLDKTIAEKEASHGKETAQVERKLARAVADAEARVAEAERATDSRVAAVEKAHKRAMANLERDCERAIADAEVAADKRVERMENSTSTRMRHLEEEHAREKIAMERELKQLRATVRIAEAKRIAAAVHSTIAGGAGGSGIHAVAPEHDSFAYLDSSLDDSGSDWERDYRRKKAAKRRALEKKAADEAAAEEAEAAAAKAKAAKAAAAKKRARAAARKAKAEAAAAKAAKAVAEADDGAAEGDDAVAAEEKAAAAKEARKAKRARLEARRKAREAAKAAAASENDADEGAEESAAAAAAGSTAAEAGATEKENDAGTATRATKSKGKKTTATTATRVTARVTAKRTAKEANEENGPADGADPAATTTDTEAACGASASQPKKRRLFSGNARAAPAGAAVNTSTGSAGLSDSFKLNTSANSGLFGSFTDKGFRVPKLKTKK